MKAVFILLMVSVGLAGCKGSSKIARARAEGMAIGRQQSQAMPQQFPAVSTVSVVGMVRNKYVQWVEGITLARAIVAADYYDLRDPTAIYLIRSGASTYINPKDILSGVNDPTLMPGDIIDIRR